MDVVGHQELLETLSQSSSRGSGSTSRGGGGGKSKSNNSLNHRHQEEQQQRAVYHDCAHRSTASGTGGGKGSSSGGGSSSISSSHSHHVDEAYRRLGQRLSAQAHGDGVMPLPKVARIKLVHDKPENSAFVSVAAAAEAGTSPSTSLNSRTSKVQKMNYSDHGNHHPRPESCLIKSITVHAKEKFQIWQQQNFREQETYASSSSSAAAAAHSSVHAPPYHPPTSNSNDNIKTGASSRRREAPGESASNDSSALSRYLPQHQQEQDVPNQQLPPQQQQQQHSQLLSRQQQQQQQQHSLMGPPLSTTKHHNHSSGSSKKGLLAAVLEGNCENDASMSASSAGMSGPQQSQQSSQQHKQQHADNRSHYQHHQGGQQQQLPQHQLRGIRDESVPNSAGAPGPTPHHHQQQLHNHHRHRPHPPPRGACLTSPSEAVANEGFDNVEGNLIVFENDLIEVSKQSVKTLQQEQQDVIQQDEQYCGEDYRIVSLLGQGTFAQVFQCLHLSTGKLVAVKIVKNKPAYTRQAAVEVDVFRAMQQHEKEEEQKMVSGATGGAAAQSIEVSSKDYMVNLECFFFYRSHLCLVFELLGLNLYEVLKRRQFRGLPLSIVQSIIHQALVGVRDLASKAIVHCDLKPENVLLISEGDEQEVVTAGEGSSTYRGSRSAVQEPSILQNADTGAFQSDRGAANGKPWLSSRSPPKVKLIDFGSACFEGYTSHTYIQSRFYRSPEVLVGLPYDSAVDMWSLGCIAAELFLGLPILPGVHEHDQLARITEMIGKIPDWMLDQGSKATKYYLKFLAPRPIPSVDSDTHTPASPSPMQRTPSPVVTSVRASPAPPIPQWRLKTQHEYIGSLTPTEIRKKGGLAKLEKQPGNRYFKCKRLADILAVHAQSTSAEDKALVPAFIHFLYGLLDPDPWRRLTALQGIQHPFVTGDLSQLRKKAVEMKLNPKEENHANVALDNCWQCPLDQSICRRKLLCVQKMREKQQSTRRNLSGRPQGPGGDLGFLQLDSHHNRKAESVSPSSGKHTTTPMDESPMPAKSLVRGGSLPVYKLSGSFETLDSTPSIQPPLRKSGSESLGPMTGNPSSLCFGRPGTNARPPLSIESDVVSGLESEYHAASGVPTVTGESRQAPLISDFAYALALQRPGVVPGAGSIAGDAGSFCSANVSVCSMVRSEGPTPALSGFSAGEALTSVSDHFSAGIKTGPLNSTTSTLPLTQGSSFVSNQSDRGGVGACISGQNNTPFSRSIQFSNQQLTPQAGGLPSSAASSITMHDSSYQNLMYQQTQPQFSGHQQSMFLHQQAQVMQQPQHFALPPQPQMQFPPGQIQTQFQPLPMQQQPVYLASAPGAGYYYVATSATGQPILLQPLAVLDQQNNPYGGNNMDNNMPPQGYGHHHPNMNLNLMHAAPMHVPMQAAGGAPILSPPQHFGSTHYNFQQQHTAMYAPPPPQQQQYHQHATTRSRKPVERPPSHYRGGASM